VSLPENVCAHLRKLLWQQISTGDTQGFNALAMRLYERLNPLDISLCGCEHFAVFEVVQGEAESIFGE